MRVNAPARQVRVLCIFFLEVVIQEVELEIREILFDSRGSEEGEEAVDAIPGVVAGDVVEEKLGQLHAKGAIVQIPHTVLNTP